MNPHHIAIIPDGNRRWARDQGLSIGEGHQRGAEVMRQIALHAAERGITYLSIWGLSLNNFRHRSAREVATLLRLFQQEFKELTTSSDIHRRNIHIRALGKWREYFPRPVKVAIEAAESATRSYGKHFLTFLLAYNGTDEMVEAIKTITQEARSNPKLAVTPELLKRHLLTHDLPPVDVMIRTGGESHLSAGFMMWDMADAHLFFTPKYWPEFRPNDFDEALAQIALREKRLGK